MQHLQHVCRGFCGIAFESFRDLVEFLLHGATHFLDSRRRHNIEESKLGQRAWQAGRRLLTCGLFEGLMKAIESLVKRELRCAAIWSSAIHAKAIADLADRAKAPTGAHPALVKLSCPLGPHRQAGVEERLP